MNAKIILVIISVIFAIYYNYYKGLSFKPFEITINNSLIKISRVKGGVPKIYSDDYNGALKGLGYMHAMDRTVQMYLVKLVGEGRLSEATKATENSLKIDIFMRRQNFKRDSIETVKKFSKELNETLNSYLEGVNHYINTNYRPFEFFLADYQPEPYTLEDSLRLFKLMAYAGLGETQEDMERFIIKSLQNEKGAKLMVKS
jgi:penicillin G amidase